MAELDLARQDLAKQDLAEPSERKVPVASLLAGGVGNLLEWYDFGLYGLFAPILAHLFFPAHDRIASLLGAYAGFAIGFAVRPLGGIVFGHLGDRVGRRFVLVSSVVMMGLATTAMALLPTYEAIGVGAPVLLLLIRVLQGFSVGGEFTGSVAYLVETAPPHRRGLAGSVANIGASAGMLLAAGVATATATLATSDEVQQWAWRIPFLIGGLIAITGYLLRHGLPEAGYVPKASTQTSTQDSLPLRKALAEAPGPMLLALLFTSGYGVVDYVTMIFLPTYATVFGGVAEKEALAANTAGQALTLAVVPIAAWLTDWAFSRRALLIGVFVAELAIAWWGIAMARHGGVEGVWIAQLAFAFLFALIMAAEPATLAELFPSEYRLSGYSLSFNLGIGIAGGTAPLVATALIAATGSDLAPAWYLMVASVIACGAAYLMADWSRKPLR
jgi:MFS transporter, MHS family, proline/betaine transporter